VHLEGRATAIPPVPPYIEVWRSVRATGDTKTRRSRRTLALPRRCVDALRAQRVQQAADRLAAGPSWKESGLVVTTAVGSEMDPANVRLDLRRSAQAGPGMEPKDWTPRELRHSFVSLLSDAGVPVETLSQLVGHGGTSITEIVHRHQIGPVIQTGPTVMDELFGQSGAAR
jgi:integrase